MDPEALVEAVGVSRQVGHVFLATADRQGLPHITPGENLTLMPAESRISAEAWFCPQTVANLEANPLISLVAWDFDADRGYQLLGRAEKVEDISILNGYAPGSETPVPQGKKRLTIRVEKILSFRHAPHTDREL